MQIVFALLLALALRQKMATWMRYYFRTAFFLPFLLSGAATGIVLAYMLHTEFGVVNYYLGFLGIEPIPWLNSAGYCAVHDRHGLSMAVCRLYLDRACLAA